MGKKTDTQLFIVQGIWSNHIFHQTEFLVDSVWGSKAAANTRLKVLVDTPKKNPFYTFERGLVTKRILNLDPATCLLERGDAVVCKGAF